MASHQENKDIAIGQLKNISSWVSSVQDLNQLLELILHTGTRIMHAIIGNDADDSAVEASEPYDLAATIFWRHFKEHLVVQDMFDNLSHLKGNSTAFWHDIE